jgi:hypothetical protein
MALRPEERYNNATDFREALRRVGRTTIEAVKVQVNEPFKADSQVEETVVRGQDNTAPHLALVEWRRRFGPGAIAALLLIIFAVAVAVFYNSEERLPAAPKNTAAVANPGDSKQPTPAPRKADHALANNSAVTNTKKEANDRESASERVNEKKKEAVAVNSRPAATKSLQSIKSLPVKSRRAVGAPTLRLPNPELGNNLSAPANESGTRAFGSSTAAPQFFRAADGTLTVKFSDGSTRVVKPGERTSRPD